MYTISQISALISAQRLGDREQEIDWLLTDSRSLCFPETSLFFALVTSRGDGHRYIDELYARGVRAFVVSREVEGNYPDANFLLVPNTLVSLQLLAEKHRSTFNFPIIGIAGSNGKTTVKEWLYQMLYLDWKITRSPRSFNSQIGVPLSVWALNSESEIGVFEAAISKPGEMNALQRIIRPTIGVFTCLGSAHQENFESLEQKCKEKLSLFRDVDTLIYPQDNEMVEKCLREMTFSCRLVPVPVIGDAFEDNLQTCAAVCRVLGIREEIIQQRLAQLEPVAMRLEVKEGRNGCTIINDTYNSDLSGLDIALDFMNRRPDRKGRARMLILSDIQQSGMTPEELYKKVCKLVENRGVEFFYGVGETIFRYKECFLSSSLNCSFFTSTEELLVSPMLENLKERLVLVKGARIFHFDELVEHLEKRVHETILEVDLGAVVDNLNYYRSFLHKQTKMVCMVKANAYGAGAVEIAKTLQDHQVDYLAVAVADEGVELRRSGISSNIMIMNPEMTSFDMLFRYNLEPEVYSFRLLEALIHAAEKQGVTNFPIHVKLDTGMHRLGFDPKVDILRLVERLHRQNALIPRSVFSHFVGSDSDGFDDFSASQYVLFCQGADELQKAFHHHILRHICNSAGIEHFPERQMDMVRLGLGLYGINSRNNQPIHNVTTLKTTILQIHDVPAGDSVGYSRKTFLQRNSRIAAIPIGYADGLDRYLGNRHSYCLVNGKKAEYVGNICMDVCMIDVTDIPCQEGDTVIVFGKDLPVTTLSDTTGTIPYEILTSVSSRVKRIYFRKN